MDVKQFLLTNKLINKSEVARLMYPDRAGAVSKFLAKLYGTGGRHFDREDALQVMEVLKQLNVDLSGLTVADDY